MEPDERLRSGGSIDGEDDLDGFARFGAWDEGESHQFSQIADAGILLQSED